MTRLCEAAASVRRLKLSQNIAELNILKKTFEFEIVSVGEKVNSEWSNSSF